MVRNRGFVMVAEIVWSHYHQRRREIDRTWRGGGMTEETIGIQPAIDADLDVLRSQIRSVAKDYPGPYLIPV
jgi:hypothetical protein